jgi:EAL domain-containing protein (putative c-di-GMP-specific phosphodiesterase class I)
MYASKKDGRNQYTIYREDDDPGPDNKFDLERELRAAIAADAFTLHYQPWISTKDHRVAGAEALIRWNHPRRGLVYPDGFINLAEDTRLIIPIGEWVLRHACRQAKAWQDAGLTPVPVSVNLSAWQLHKQSLVRTVDKALAESGLHPSYLHVEITETVAMRDANFTMSILNALTARGVGVALDDFGKGYSSLSYLKQFPIRTLKIDRSFIEDLHRSPKDQAIVSATIQLAHNLGLRVVAEGVENNSQLNFLKTEGADLIQGYIFAKPLPEPQFRELLGRGIPIQV